MEQLDESESEKAGSADPARVGEDAVVSRVVPDDLAAMTIDDGGTAAVVASLPSGPAASDAATPVRGGEPSGPSVVAPAAPWLGDVRTGAYAQVLHDEPLQLVVAAMLHLDGLPAQYRQPSVQRSVELLERAAERLHQLVHAMSVPDDQDTIPAIVQRAVEALLGGRGVRLESVGETDVPLTGPADHAARVILVAALADIRRRASVSTVTLDLRTVGSTVVITLQDDGAGRLPPEPRPVAAPLADLRARAAAVGGTLDIRSLGVRSPDAGSADTGPGPMLTLTLPVEPGSSAPARS